MVTTGRLKPITFQQGVTCPSDDMILLRPSSHVIVLYLRHPPPALHSQEVLRAEEARAARRAVGGPVHPAQGPAAAPPHAPHHPEAPRHRPQAPRHPASTPSAATGARAQGPASGSVRSAEEGAPEEAGGQSPQVLPTAASAGRGIAVGDGFESHLRYSSSPLSSNTSFLSVKKAQKAQYKYFWKMLILFFVSMQCVSWSIGRVGCTC